MEIIAPLLDWISNNPTWAGLFVMLTAFAESLALVGLFLPGAAMMFGIGALVGTGHMELWPTLAWAAVGAIAGDGVSFWLGRTFHQRIRVMWPFRTHPELIARSTRFFYRHGGKSILLGRFIGPIRPVIPAVAGMLEMPTGRFLIVNIISGLCWAPVYVLPGMVFATSLGLAAEAATRLAVLGGFLIVLILVLVWLTRLVFDWIHRHTYAPMRRLLEWTRLHPVMGEVPAALLDPEHREARGLTLLALILLTAAALTAWLLPLALGSEWLRNINHYVFHTLQTLRTPAMDHVMVAITQLGDTTVLGMLFLVLFGWLGWQRRWHAAGHWLAAAVFSVALTQLLKAATHIERPIALYDGASALSFPSGHASHSMVVFGFLAVLIGRELNDQRRFVVYAFTVTLVSAIAFSRLYLGAHWLSDVIGGLFFGLAWVALLGIAYRHHPSGALNLRGLLAATLLSLGAVYGWNSQTHFERDLQRYAVQRETVSMATRQWWTAGWHSLPAYRHDIRGYRDHPLTLQYAGGLAPLRQQLEAAGWYGPMRADALNWLNWLSSQMPIHQLPVMPQVHDGRNESLLLVRKSGDTDTLFALRLWRTDITLQPGNRPLWTGNVSTLHLSANHGLYVPRTGKDFATPLKLLLRQVQSGELSGFRYRQPQSDGRQLLMLRYAAE